MRCRGLDVCLAGTLLVSVVGCQGALVNGKTVASLTTGLEVTGTVQVPSSLVSNNAGSLVSNNAGSLVSNNSGAYRILSLGNIPLASAFVYLLDPEERFYVGPDGGRLSAVTDAQGHYLIDHAPEGKPIFVASLLDGNRREVGFTVGNQGSLQVDVNLGTTYTTEFLRAEARRTGHSLGAYPLSQVQAIATETNRLLEAGQLGCPDLTIGEAAAMNRSYVVAFGSRGPALLDLWEKLIGRRPLIVTTEAGNYSEGSQGDGGLATAAQFIRPAGIAFDGDGSLLVGDSTDYVIRRVAPDGKISRIAGAEPGVDVEPPAETGDDVATAEFPDNIDLKVDPDGNLLVTYDNGEDDNGGFWIICRKEGSTAYGFAQMHAGKVYRYGAPAQGYLDGDQDTTRFGIAAGLALDDAGNLFIADRGDNLIRRIDRATGRTTTVAGNVHDPDLDVSSVLTGTYDGDGAALEHALREPYGLAWRRHAGVEELFVWDGGNNAIRKVTFTGGDYAQGQLKTILGDGTRKHLDQINLLDDQRFQIPDAVPGLALDNARERLYFADYNAHRVQVLDLLTGKASIVVGGGATVGDDEADRVKLGNLGALLVGPDGSLYFSDSVYHVVRRVHFEQQLK